MKALAAILICSLGYGYSPVSPAREFDSKMMAITVYGEHSGQGIFEEKYSAMSVLNTGGLQVNMAPFRYFQIGGYLGVAEFDHNGAGEDINQLFNSGFTFNGGLDAKILSPKFAGDKAQLIAGSSAGYFKPSDDNNFEEKLLEIHTELGIHYTLANIFNIGLGGEFFMLQGDTRDFPFTGDDPLGNRDYFRGMLSFEFYPKPKEDEKKSTFINMTFKIGPDPGFDSDFGFQNVAIYIGLGVMTPWKKEE